jgi:hypothetical protein
MIVLAVFLSAVVTVVVATATVDVDVDVSDDAVDDAVVADDVVILTILFSSFPLQSDFYIWLLSDC